MQVNKIYSTTLKLPQLVQTELPKNNTKNSKNISCFPKLYGAANVAFCGKDKEVTVNDFIKAYEAKSKNINNQPLPIFPYYGTSMLHTMKYLCATGSCFLESNDEIDSKEIFKENLKTSIKQNRFRNFGFDKNTPIVELNMADYLHNPDNAITNIEKDVKKQLKGFKKTPILFLENASYFMDEVRYPYEFFQSSIFKKYPSVLFVAQGFNVFNKEEAKTLNVGRNGLPEGEEDYILNEYDFKHLFSKMKLLKDKHLITLHSVPKALIKSYLTDKTVQKKLLTNGKDIKITNEAIDFAIDMGRAKAFFQDPLGDYQQRQRLLETDGQALNNTINSLKLMIISMLAVKPSLKEIDGIDVLNNFIPGINASEFVSKFQEVEMTALTQKILAAKEASKEQEPKPKEEPPKPEEKEPPKTREAEDEVKSSNFEVVREPKTRFTDVGGMYNIKKQLKEEFIDIITNPKVANSQKPSGVLLSGPPGCGKTLLARAIAGEAQVPFLTTAGSSFVEIYVGVGAKRVRELYAKAREEAKAHPSKTAIVFIDEIDAVAGSRGKGTSSEDLRTINALLHEMDGSANKDKQDIKIITIVATNNDSSLDDAFKRSGRIDLKYTIDDPRYSVKAREEILKIHSKDANFKDDSERKMFIRSLAETTSGLSGADLAELVKKANRMSLRIGRDKDFITEEDIQEAKMQIKAGIKTDIEHTDFELQQTVSHEAGHAINAMVIEKVFEDEKNKHKMPNKVLDFITNSARGNTLGATYYKPSSENKMLSKETYLADLITLYGGYSTESMLFDTHSENVSNDLEEATKIVEKAISVGDFGSQSRYLALNSDLTKSLFAAELKEDMITFAKKGMDISKKIIEFTKPFIEAYTTKLIANKDCEEQVVSADSFKAQFSEWLQKENKQEEYQKLCSQIKDEIHEFCDDKEKQMGKIGFSKN